MANPRIAIFARLADGNVAPARVIEGGHTRLSRTSHAIAYDDKNDEIVIPNPLAEAILTYAGGASGDVAPIRTIQGPKTLLQENDELALDSVHDEIVVPTRQAILIFSRSANGNVAPVRPLDPREVEFITGVLFNPRGLDRAWEYWMRRAGFA